MSAQHAVHIRAWRLDDAEDLARAVSNPHILDNLRDGIPYPYTARDAEQFIQSMLDAEQDSQYAFAITLDDRAVGSIGVFRGQNVHRLTAEMGYYLAEPYWGQGIGTRAVQDVCRFVFEQTDIVRIFAEPYAHNTAPCRLLEKVGFTLEGTMRQNAIKNGRIVDMQLYALLKEEYSPEG